MEIAYVVPSLDDTTGWGRWCADFLRHVTSIGVTPIVWAPSSLVTKCPQLEASGTVSCNLPGLFDHLQSTRGLRSLPAIIRFMQSRMPDRQVRLVHSLEAYPWGIYGDHLARRYGVPHILTAHGRYGYIAADRPLDRMVFRRVMTRAAAFVTVSEAVGNAIRSRMDVLPSSMRILAVQNAVDVADSVTAPESDPPHQLGSPLILSVTRFVAVKDLETAVLAFEKVRARIPDARYVIVGPGDGPHNAYHERVVRLISDRQIRGIEIIGRVPRNQLPSYYQRASLLLHTAQTLPDDFEASGLVLLEAGLHGLPVVASASGGIPEVVSHNVTGLLVPEKDVGATSEAILQLLREPETARRLGDANADRARERNWHWYMSQMSALYSNALGGRPVSSARSS